MIIHILTVLFVVLFWNTTVSITCFGKSIVLPLSLIVLGYILSVYIIVKSFWTVQKFINSILNSKTKIEEAKDKCAESLLAYIQGDSEYGNTLWQEARKYLSDDKLFSLLGVLSIKFSKAAAEECLQKLPGCSLISEYFCSLSADRVEESCANLVYSKSNLVNIIAEYKAPWAYRALIAYYLNNNEPIAADGVLKEFAKSDKIAPGEWRQLKARIFLKEAELEGDMALKIKLYRKANRLDNSLAVFELAKYYKARREFGKARRCIEDAWKSVPSIKLGKIYTELDEFDTIPIHKFQHAQELCKLNENHPISHILVATYAMESELWALALEYLNKFKEQYEALASMLLARLEAKRTGDSTKIWKNIEKAFVLVAHAQNLDVEGIV